MVSPALSIHKNFVKIGRSAFLWRYEPVRRTGKSDDWLTILFARIIRFTVQKFQLFCVIFCIIIFFIELRHILILRLAKMPNGGMPVFTLIATGWRYRKIFFYNKSSDWTCSFGDMLAGQTQTDRLIAYSAPNPGSRSKSSDWTCSFGDMLAGQTQTDRLIAYSAPNPGSRSNNMTLAHTSLLPTRRSPDGALCEQRDVIHTTGST